MIAEFDWWLLFVGLVVGAGLTWLVVAESRRRDIDLDEAERASEAAWIAERLTAPRRRVDVALVEQVLAEHRGYLAGPPPDPAPMPPRSSGTVEERRDVSEDATEDGIVN
ncbi:MAG: hypothetical protein AABZ33_12540 [Chloroflexota bacterium]